jgi:protein ImuB
MRLACLYVPDFPLAALWRAQPELRGERVAVADGQGPRAKLLAISPAGARHGVAVGLTMAQAMAIDADLIVRPVVPDTVRAAQAALCDAAESFSPRVEDAGDGVAYLDLDGLGSLYASESPLANALAQRAASVGLDVQVGVAGSKIAAYLAARHGGGVTVVPPGEEASLLAPVPLALLEPSPALTVTLRRWGICCLGDLAALPASAVGTRLGPEGVLLVRRARGEDEHPLVPRALPLHFEESIDLEYGLDTLEPLLFVLRGLLDRLTARLAVRGLICGDLRLSLRLATRGRDERTVTVAAPSNDVKALLALVRLHFEVHPPAAAIEALRVTAIPERLRAAQLDLFRPRGPAPARLAVTLARLTAICGADHVGMPVVADSHRPDAYGVAAFGSDFLPPRPLGSVDFLARTSFETPPKEGGSSGRTEKSCRFNTSTARAEEAPSSQGPSRSPRSSVSTRPLGEGRGEGYSNANTALTLTLSQGEREPEREGSTIIPLALRAVRPAQAVEVFCDRDRPEFVRGDHFAGRVVHVAGPWRVHTDWWNEQATTRDYYDVQLSDGGVYRLYHERVQREWFVEGIYD